MRLTLTGMRQAMRASGNQPTVIYLLESCLFESITHDPAAAPSCRSTGSACPNPATGVVATHNTLRALHR